MTVKRKYRLAIFIAAAVIGLCGLGFWQWSSHDQHLFDQALRSGVCDGRPCDNTTQHNTYLEKYSDDGNAHALTGIVLVTTAVAVSLAGVILTVLVKRDSK